MGLDLCLPVHHHSAEYIFWSFGVIGLILRYLEKIVLLKRVLGVWPVLHVSSHEQTRVLVDGKLVQAPPPHTPCSNFISGSSVLVSW